MADELRTPEGSAPNPPAQQQQQFKTDSSGV